MNVALSLAQRAVFMEKGEVRFSGPTKELLERGDILRSVFLEGAASAVGVEELEAVDGTARELEAKTREAARAKASVQEHAA